MWADADRNYQAGPLPLEHTGLVGEVEKRVLGTARWFDRFQSRHTPVAFGYAVFKKYADDEGSRLAALMAYYTFLSLFPLAIGAVAALNIFLSQRPDVVQRIIEDVIPEQFQEQVLAAYTGLPSQGPALAIALIGLLMSGTAGAFSLYAAVNQVFAVPYRFRYGYGPRYLRVIATVVLLEVSVVIAGVGSGLWTTFFDLAGIERLGVFGLSASAFSAALYFSAKVLCRRPLTRRELLPGAILAGAIVSAVIGLASVLVAQFVASTTPVYGVFATVIAVISVLLLATNGVVFALEISAVRAWELWPRGIDIHLLYPADERAYALLTLMDERMPSQRNDVRFDATGHFDPRRPDPTTLTRRQPGIPRTPFDELG